MNKFVNHYNNKHENNQIHNFCESFSLTNIVKEPTCYKNPIKPTVIETGLSDYHLMTVTCINKYIKNYRLKLPVTEALKHLRRRFSEGIQ